MIEKITTHVVRCDGPNCDESYAAVVEVSSSSIKQFAKRDGWEIDSYYGDFCPTCTKTRKDGREAGYIIDRQDDSGGIRVHDRDCPRRD